MRKMKRFGFAALAAFLAISGCDAAKPPEAVDMSIYEKVHINPFPSLEEEWEDYGNGDPFVMRHDGRYYLYVSTKDRRPGIKAWVSDNLTDWTYAGLVTEDPVSTGAYAPEVYYWNGYFYLYTSPAGHGHYVFRSASPTGPFERITDNLGLSIDGSVFIDDDGSWTFLHAGSSGIVGVPMDGPASFGFGQTIPGTSLGHWTEGPMIIKRNGTYYLTFTGNHVFSKGYRIHYAVSKESPTGPYRMLSNHLLAISTKPDFFGLGHSSTVMGPDLDSYYLVYHNLIGASAEGPPVRKMNIDRLVFNGDVMDLLGPTNFPQPVPKMPDFADRLDASIDPSRWETSGGAEAGTVVSRQGTGSVYTAEFNFRLEGAITADTRVGAVFGYADADHYGLAEIHPAAGKISLVRVEDGRRSVLGEAELPAEFDYSKLHTIRVERGSEEVRVYADGMLKLKSEAPGLGAGKIGYRYEHAAPVFSFTAFSNQVDGSSDFEAVKPLPGTLHAVHYLQGENRGFAVRKRTDRAEWRRGDGTDIREADEGDYSVVLHDAGDWLRYAVYVSESGVYGLDLKVRSPQPEAEIELLIDDESAGVFRVSVPEGYGDGGFVRVRAGHAELSEGFHTLMIKLKKGPLEWKTMHFERMDLESFQAERLLEEATAEDQHGMWRKTEAGYAGAENEDAKLYGGNPRWSDYRVETTVTLGERTSGKAGVLFRVTNESHFPQQVTDALRGYFLAVTPTKLELYKHNYDAVLLQAKRMTLPRNQSVHLQIEAVAGTIRVYVDSELALEYNDPNAFMTGRVGIRSDHARDIVLGDLSAASLPSR